MQADVAESLSRPSNVAGALLYLRTFAGIAAAVWLGQRFPILLVPITLFLGARQHSLYVLNHEAAHGNLFTNGAANRWVATVFSNFLFFHHAEAYSFVQWRRIHRLHHAFLFTERDPNFQGRVRAGDTKMPYGAARIALECLKAPFLAVYATFLGQQDYVGPDSTDCGKTSGVKLLFFPIRHDAEMEIERRWKLFFFAFAGILLYRFSLFPLFAKFWLLPMYTTYPAILRLMDLTEHNWSAGENSLHLTTNTTYPRYWEKIFVSDLSRSLHYEHHLWPQIPCYRLSVTARLLSQVPAAPAPIPRKGFWKLSNF